MRLSIFAIISQVAFDFAKGKTILNLNLSVIYTLLCCFLMLWAMEYFNKNILKILCALFFMALAYRGDWGSVAPIWVLGFYYLRKHGFLRFLPYILISTYRVLEYLIQYWGKSLVPAIMMAGLALFIPVILLYNGKPGKQNAFNKWFFYIIYPAHLFLIGLILLIK